jgi:hypothetical protein
LHVVYVWASVNGTDARRARLRYFDRAIVEECDNTFMLVKRCFQR